VGYVESKGEMRNAYKIVVGKHEGQRPLGSYLLEYNIIMDLREVGWESVDWMHLA
jgi:hypothetical protein